MITWNVKATSWTVIGWPSDHVRSSRMTTLSYWPSLLLLHSTMLTVAPNGSRFQSMLNNPNPVSDESSLSDTLLKNCGLVRYTSFVRRRLMVLSQFTWLSSVGNLPSVRAIFWLFSGEVFLSLSAPSTLIGAGCAASYSRRSFLESRTGRSTH